MAIITLTSGDDPQTAVNDATAGDTLNFRPGTYICDKDSTRGLQITKQLELYSVDANDDFSPHTAHLLCSPDNSSLYVIDTLDPGDSDGSIINGFEISGAMNAGIVVKGSYITTNYNKIHDICRVEQSPVQDPNNIGRTGIGHRRTTRYCTAHGNMIYDIGRVPVGDGFDPTFQYGGDWCMYNRGAFHTITCNLLGGIESGSAMKFDCWEGTAPSPTNVPDTLVAFNTFFQHCRGGSLGTHNSTYSNLGSSARRPGIWWVGNAYVQNSRDEDGDPNSKTTGCVIAMCYGGGTSWPPVESGVHGNWTTTARLIPTAAQVGDQAAYLIDINDPAVYSGNTTGGNATAAFVAPATVYPDGNFSAWDAAPKDADSPLIGAAPWDDPGGFFTLPSVDMFGNPYINRGGTRTAGAVEFVSGDYPMGTFSKNGVIPAAAISGNIQTASSGTLPACTQFRIVTPTGIANGTVTINGIGHSYAAREQIIGATSGGAYSGLPAGSTLEPLG